VKKKVSEEESLHYHEFPKSGKLGITPTVPFSSQEDLSLAYTPGVAFPCKAIQANQEDAYRYTSKKNLVAVISNGTAVLGLGNIGAMASKPVMEGKAILFKRFSGLDSFDIEVDEHDIDKFCDIVEAISPTFGGINLEDIKAPECFEIENRLVAKLDIPVMHDDQHGTAIISSAGLINACELTSRKLEDVKIVIVGAGAAGFSCAKMYRSLGVKNIIMLDSRGVVYKDRKDINSHKREFAIDKKISKLEAFKDADMVLGLSKPGSFDVNDIMQMKKDPIIFALANPTPEIFPEEIMKAREDAIIGTGRSDYDNQINNVLGFPFIFRGALDMRAKAISMNMKKAATFALASLAKKEASQKMKDLFSEDLDFGKKYIIPKPFDERLLVEVSSAVAKAAYDEGLARVKEFNLEDYRAKLAKLSKEI